MIPTRESTSFIDILQQQVADRPDKVSYTFLLNGETEDDHLTYQQLDQQAQMIAAHLQAIDAVGERVLLPYPSGLDFVAAFIGCLYAGAIAVPTFLPYFNRPDQRFLNILNDAAPKVLLTDSPTLAQIHKNADKLPGSDTLHLLATDTLEPQVAAAWQRPDITQDSLAFLQYTSGSTSTPKGVMVSHGNLISNATAIQEKFEDIEDKTGVIWLPMYHDLGLLGGVLQPAFLGASVILMSPIDFMQKPSRWLTAISNYQATTSGAPNFAYDICVDYTTPEDREDLDLSSWTLAFAGAEPVRAGTLARFAETFEPYGFRREAFYPSYGLAEATLILSGGERTTETTILSLETNALEKNMVIAARSDDERAFKAVSCGTVVNSHEIKIVHPEKRQLCRTYEIGEIWIAGPNVTQGYWNKPEETETAFKATLVNGEGPFLRTGDLGFIKKDELFIAGRLKDVIIIHGRNHYPQDLELTVEQSHRFVRATCSAAFAVDTDQGEQLVITCEVDGSHRAEFEPNEVITAIRKAVSDHHQVDVYAVALLKLGTIPKTSSGKIQRRECRSQFLSQVLSTVAVWDSAKTSEAADALKDKGLEAARAMGVDGLARELQEKIGDFLRIPPDEIDVTQPIYDLGLGSLGALAIQTHLEKQYNVHLQVEVFFREVSTKQLIKEILDGTVFELDSTSDQPSDEAVDEQLNRTKLDAASDLPNIKNKFPEFSLFFFASEEADYQKDKYRLVIEAAKFGDSHDFSAVWLPERHFHAFGGLYPNPVVLAAALAQETENIRLRSGSVVLPLHHPIRVTEDWAVVDNLSNGRVDLAFAVGWNVNDFILAPENFEQREEITYQGIETIQRLWRGEAVAFPNGVGEMADVRAYPMPQQSDLGVWLTCADSEDRYAYAGAKGYNVLAALLFHPLESLAKKIAIYREARAKHGYDPNAGQVTLMLHTFVGSDMDQVRQVVEKPLIDYLASSKDLWHNNIETGFDLTEQSEQQILQFAMERYIQSSSLIGTPDRCATMIANVQAVGVDEIACLIDFGIDRNRVLNSLQTLQALRASSS
ncbi:MAG: MupA/Atu3671 family FMN-dependent luciferase-like monooxygenase [Chloroflexota bacterium]